MKYQSWIVFAAIIAANMAPLKAQGCEQGARRCSADAYTLEICDSGAWRADACMREQGKLCFEGECVQPWEYGAPQWPRPASAPEDTPESLAQKAAFYDAIAVRLHMHPDLNWIMSVTLDAAPDDPSQPAVPQERASWQDVAQWHSGENDGLWNALYLASQSFRHAATGDASALETIRILLKGFATRMAVTGVPGLYTRQYIPPGVRGISCPATLESYMPDVEKDDNKWVRVNANGCVETVDPATRQWNESEHCGLKQFSGWCWLDNVSKDEYSGHMFALGVTALLVDDPEALALVRAELDAVGRHLVKNRMEFVDWDGRTAEHGPIHAMTFGDYPGFNAAMSLSFIKAAAFGTGDARFEDFYRNCLLQQGGKVNCLKKKWEQPRPYTEYLATNGMYPGFEGCGANYNNISMHMLSLFTLIWLERDPALREIYQRSFDEDVVRAPDQPRAVILQNNAWFDFMWASMKRNGPEHGPALEAVDNGIRMLRQFPARKHAQKVECPPGICREYCLNRFGRPTGNAPRTPAQRCASTFLWWRDPYDLDSCEENRLRVVQPSDYLLAYWMGRYFGFIDADM